MRSRFLVCQGQAFIPSTVSHRADTISAMMDFSPMTFNYLLTPFMHREEARVSADFQILSRGVTECHVPANLTFKLEFLTLMDSSCSFKTFSLLLTFFMHLGMARISVGLTNIFELSSSNIVWNNASGRVLNKEVFAHIRIICIWSNYNYSRQSIQRMQNCTSPPRSDLLCFNPSSGEMDQPQSFWIITCTSIRTCYNYYEG